MLYRLPDDQEYGWKVSCWCSSWLWSPWIVIYWYKFLLSSGIKLLKGVWVRWLGKMREKVSLHTTQFIIDDSWIWILFWMEFSLNLAKDLNHIYTVFLGIVAFYSTVMFHEYINHQRWSSPPLVTWMTEDDIYSIYLSISVSQFKCQMASKSLL